MSVDKKTKRGVKSIRNWLIGVDTSVLYLMRGGKPMKKIIAIILVTTMLACNSVNAASFVQDKKVELNNEHMKDSKNTGVGRKMWKFGRDD